MVMQGVKLFQHSTDWKAFSAGQIIFSEGQPAGRRRAQLNGCRKPWRCHLAHEEVQWTPSHSVRGDRW